MFLNHKEEYFKERFFLPAVKKNTSRKQISHPSGQNAPSQGQLSLRPLCLRALLHYALGIHSYPRLKQIDLGSISINSE